MFNLLVDFTNTFIEMKKHMNSFSRANLIGMPQFEEIGTCELTEKLQRNMQRHTVSVNEENDDMEHETDDGSPTPFSKAIKAIQERIAKSMKKGLVDESLIWHSKFNEEDLEKRSFSVPSLQELCLNILANHADAIASLDSVSEELKQRLSTLLCDLGKMNGHFLELLLSGFSNVIRLKDCFWLTEEEFIKYFGTLDTSILEMLQVCTQTFSKSPTQQLRLNHFLQRFNIDKWMSQETL
ncbi:uncharacterized protein [Medicago truncatula]|uniref:uncharacterized protein isoform X1 n=2 Tax=Medicago truncatula TaxID=3880 RepID=UPI000D2F44E1|nr:uncharacterized protein LOC25494174 isoform X1 [Medicago truncatula]